MYAPRRQYRMLTEGIRQCEEYLARHSRKDIRLDWSDDQFMDEYTETERRLGTLREELKEFLRDQDTRRERGIR